MLQPQRSHLRVPSLKILTLLTTAAIIDVTASDPASCINDVKSAGVVELEFVDLDGGDTTLGIFLGRGADSDKARHISMAAAEVVSIR